MYSEKRKDLRVDTFIPIEMKILDEMRNLFNFFNGLRWDTSQSQSNESKLITGYVENLSANGMRVISLDSILPGTLIASYFLTFGSEFQPLSASLIHFNRNSHVFFYGFRFLGFNSEEQTVLKRYIKSSLEEMKGNKNAIPLNSHC